MFKKILVPLDGSVLAERALKVAVALAQKEGGDIILLRVPDYRPLPQLAGVPLELDEAEAHERVERYLKSVRQVHAFLDVPIKLVVAAGDKAGVIVDTAAAESVDLIVMSTHGRTGLTRWVLGSVTEKVLQAAPCPVLAVRSESPPSRILVPLDGSLLAEQSIAHARRLASHFDAVLFLLRVVEPVDPEAMGLEPLELPGAEIVRQLQDNLCQTTENYLHGLAEQTASPAGVETSVMVGTPAAAILDYAEGHHIDLIVMTTHGATSLPRWAYGSVTERVVHGAQCAMLVVRPAH